MRRCSWVLPLCLLACQPPSEDPAGPPTTFPSQHEGGKADLISPADNPDLLWPAATRRLRDLVTAADIGRSFGSSSTPTVAWCATGAAARA